VTPRYLSLSITDSVTSHCITLTLLGSTIKLQEPFRRQETGDSHRTSTHHWRAKTKRRGARVFTLCSPASSHLARSRLHTLLARVLTPCSPASSHLARPRLDTLLARVLTPCSPASAHLARTRRPRLHTSLASVFTPCSSTMNRDTLHTHHWMVVRVPSKSLLHRHCHTRLRALTSHVPVCAVLRCCARRRPRWPTTPCACPSAMEPQGEAQRKRRSYSPPLRPTAESSLRLGALKRSVNAAATLR
jgi:hypothetical protein